MSFHEAERNLGSLTISDLNLQTLGSLHSGEPKRDGARGLGAAFPPAARPEARQDPPPGGRGPAKWTCKVADLLGYDSRIPFSKSVDKFLITFSSKPVGIGIHFVAHEHAEEGDQGHLQEQAGDRQCRQRRLVFQIMLQGALWPGRAAGSSRLEGRTAL